MPTPRPASFVAFSKVENPGWNSECESLLGIEDSRLVRRDEPLLHGRLLDALGGQSLTVVLDAQLVAAVAGALELHAHHALRGLARAPPRAAPGSMPCTTALRTAWIAMSLTMRR